MASEMALVARALGTELPPTELATGWVMDSAPADLERPVVPMDLFRQSPSLLPPQDQASAAPEMATETEVSATA